MTLRRGALESYFDTVRAELTFWSMSDELRGHLARLRGAWDALPGDPQQHLQSGYVEQNPFPAEQRRELAAVEDGSRYAKAHRAIHPLAKAFVSERGYYDFFLIDPSGNVIYSVEKESDFASNLVAGALANSGLAQVHRRALAAVASPQVVFSDFERYEPSHGAPALFGAVAVLDAEGTPLGVLALQVPTQRIQTIMQFTAGMGDTGETYLVGRDHLMRSDSRFSEVSTTLETRVESSTVERALALETGVDFTDDYRGVRVLSAYGSFSLDAFDWAVMAEIDREEVFRSVADLRLSIPILGFVFYALSLISLWLLDPSGWTFAGMDSLEAGELPPG
jgi:methyl-accepting chemotaxis protein